MATERIDGRAYGRDNVRFRFPPRSIEPRFQGIRRLFAKPGEWLAKRRGAPVEEGGALAGANATGNGVVAQPAGTGALIAVDWRALVFPTRRNILLLLIGAFLYGTTAWMSSGITIADALDLRPAVAAPIFFGFAFGPLVGFFTGALGNSLGDTLAQQGPLTYFTYHLGNGVMGLVPGLYALIHRRYRTLPEQIVAVIVTVLSIYAAMFVGVYGEVLFQGGDAKSAFGNVISYATTNLTALSVVPLLLFNYERLDLRNRDWLKSGLVRRISAAILLSAAIPVLLLGIFLRQTNSNLNEITALAIPVAAELKALRGSSAPANQPSVQASASQSTPDAPPAKEDQLKQRAEAQSNLNLGIKMLFIVISTFALSVSNAALVALSISRPLLRLSAAAAAMEARRFTPEMARDIGATVGNDEVSQLSRLFGTMAAQIIERERSLQQEVQSLRDEIDMAKRRREAGLEPENEYFRALQARVQEIRERKRVAVGA
jgi:energy-coupling factor transport system substrate-specific component